MTQPISDQQIAQAVQILRDGGTVAMPTETVYGLAADALNPQAVERVFQIKGRPLNHPVIVHLAEPRQISDWAEDIHPDVWKLLDAFSPGPLTLILQKKANIPTVITAGQDTVGLRIPDHPVAQQLLRAFGGGLAAPSANRFTRVSPTQANDVQTDLGNDVEMILDGGPCPVGIESTIVDFTQVPPAILRLGAVTAEQIESVLGYQISLENVARTASPGQHRRHYAIPAEIRITEADLLVDAATMAAAQGQRTLILAQLPRPSALHQSVAWWQLPDELPELARVIYQTFREADRHEFELILICLPEETGIGAAIIDRIQRASYRPD